MKQPRSLLTKLAVNWPILLGLTLFTSTGCANYKVSVNDQVVYTPPNLLSGYDIPDPVLSDCLKSTIKENQIVRLEQLINLQCAPGNIQSLIGLAHFKYLSILGLSGNAITSLDGIQTLSQLKRLNVSDNQLKAAHELKPLTALIYADLRGNPSLKCDTADLSVRPEGSGQQTILLPEHCPDRNKP